MRYAFLGLALAAAVTAQGVVEPLYPDGVDSPPPKSNFPKNAFILSTIKLSDPTKPGYQPEEVGDQTYDCTNTSPKISLTGSALIDERGSTGSIVANDQFQFDGPPQAGVKVSAGWYRNDNGTLGLGKGDKASIFYNCLSGDFNNIYSVSQGEQCYPVYLSLQLCTHSSSAGVNYEAVKKENTGVFQIPEGGSDDSLPDGGDGTIASKTSSATSSSSESASATATTSEATSATSSAEASSSPASATIMTQIVPAFTPAAVAPAPVSNGTTPAPTGSSVTPPAGSSSPAPFTNAAPAIAVGQKAIAFLAAVAGAFAMA